MTVATGEHRSPCRHVGDRRRRRPITQHLRCRRRTAHTVRPAHVTLALAGVAEHPTSASEADTASRKKATSATLRLRRLACKDAKRHLHDIMNAPNITAARRFRYPTPDERKRVRIASAVERRFREVRRRTGPMGAFRDRTSVERVPFAILPYRNISRPNRRPFSPSHINPDVTKERKGLCKATPMCHLGLPLPVVGRMSSRTCTT